MTLDQMAEEYALEAQRRMKETIFGCDAWEPLAVAYRAGFLAARGLADEVVRSVRVCGRGSTTDEPDTVLWQAGQEKCLSLIRKIGEGK